jgi:hypothetical protein
MVTKEDIEAFLDRLSAEGGTYKEVEPGLWVVRAGGALDYEMVVHFSPPVVVFRVKVMQLPTDRSALASLSRRLLEMNASDMVHGSYGIEQDAIVITETLELSHLDYEEFLAVYESIALALASHIREIGSLGTSGTHRAAPANGKKRNAGKKNGRKATRAIKKVVRAIKKKATRMQKRSGGRSRGRR